MAYRDPYTRLLTDEEMRAHLERKERLVFCGMPREWQEVERQVERLGFGASYFVTLCKGPRGGTIRVVPAQGRDSEAPLQP